MLDIILIALLAFDAVLLITVIVLQCTSRKNKTAEAPKEAPKEVIEPQAESPYAEETPEEPEEEQAPVEEADEVKEEPVKTEKLDEDFMGEEEIYEETIAEPEEEPDEEEIEEDDDTEDENEETAATEAEVIIPAMPKNRKPAVPFYTKMLDADETMQYYYNVLRNEFKSYRGINARISKRCDTFRKGRELIAKITLSGKTMKLYLKLNVEDYEVTRFHQKYAGDKKSYAEIPMLVKVKSGRGLNNAVLLIAELMKNENVSKKARYTEINYINTLKGLEENR